MTRSRSGWLAAGCLLASVVVWFTYSWLVAAGLVFAAHLFVIVWLTERNT